MLKHSSGYTLKKVGNSWYLLPFGQQVADQHKAVVLNETGAFLWNTLEHTSDLEELTHHLARYYEVPESTCPELREDVQTFFRQLLSFGILEENLAPKRRDDTLNLEIAGLLLRLNGPASLFPKEFSAFASEKSELPDQEIDLVTLPPSPKANGTVLLRNPELTVMEAADRYVFLFPTMKNIREASMTKDGSYVRISCAPTSTEVRFFRKKIWPIFFTRSGCFSFFWLRKEAALPFTRPRFFIRERPGFSPATPAWENPPTPTSGTSFSRRPFSTAI